jgi:hypothetical protein
MTSDSGDCELTGSITGPDGRGNAFQPFTSASGQIHIEPDLWRRAERNRTGDRFTFEIKPAVVDEVTFNGTAPAPFVVRLAQMLPNTEHTLRLIPSRPGTADIKTLRAFQPPEVKSRP